jgi:S1-C subfamily serine protease
VTGKVSSRVHIGATAFLGVQVQGTTVADVVPGSPAEPAGLKPGDVLTSIGGKVVAGAAGVTSALLAHKRGQVVDGRLPRRDGRETHGEGQARNRSASIAAA